MQCLKVTFTELCEAEGAFGRESISPGGAVFPKHLVLSYDLHSKTIVFPAEWNIVEGVEDGKSTDFYLYQFKFGGNYHLSVVAKRLVNKSEFVNVDYNPDDFKPNKNLVIITLRVDISKKERADELVKKYCSANVIVASRARESRTVISEVSKDGWKDRYYMDYLYELVIAKEPEYEDFVNDLFKAGLVLKNQRFSVLVQERGVGVYPKQLAYFK